MRHKTYYYYYYYCYYYYYHYYYFLVKPVSSWHLGWNHSFPRPGMGNYSREGSSKTSKLAFKWREELKERDSRM